MSKLTTDQRANMPSSEYALPGGRFPVNDQNHARAALSGASRAEHVGNITPAQKATIDAKAKAKLGDSHPRQHSLAMASADNLHKAGYISGAHKDAIRAHAGKKLAAHKASKPAAYGSLAPQSAGHYMPASTDVDNDGDSL